MSDQWQQPASAWPSNSGEPIVEVSAAEAVAITQEQRNEAIKGWLGEAVKLASAKLSEMDACGATCHH
jgi:post-segregation antitoxin (ccd killing protein)